MYTPMHKPDRPTMIGAAVVTVAMLAGCGLLAIAAKLVSQLIG